MNNTSKYFQRMNDIQAVFAGYRKYELFQVMRDVIDEAEQFQSNEIAELKARVAELESGYIVDPSKDDIRLTGTLNKIKSDAILEAVLWYMCNADAMSAPDMENKLKRYADKVRRGE